MATRFIQEAEAQLAPVYQQQEQAIQSQIPAIQQLYNTLYQGLEGQRQTETQNILESASQRGVLRSSLPIDLQASLGKALLAERGKLGAQQAQDVAGVNTQLGNLRIQRSQGVTSLADMLHQIDIREREYQQRLEEQRQAAALAARGRAGGGGGGGGSYGSGLSYLAQKAGLNLGQAVNSGGLSTGSAPKVPPQLQQLYNQVFVRPDGKQWTDKDLVNDYNATFRSAQYGNSRDRQKLELYHSVRPDLFGGSIPSRATANRVGF